MNREQARQLIKDTFEATFNKEKFIIFIKDLLNKIEESTFTYRGNFIPDAFEQYISTLERIGKYTDGENEIDLLIVKLKKEASLERARTMQRNFIAWYLKGSRGGKLKDAALVAFVSPDEEDWRFSLVKMDYRFEEGKAGRVKVKEEFTPASRWSFLVGKNEKSHTAQSRIVPILEDDEHNPTLTQLEEAFNIETVTKEFFEKYRDLFIRTVDELDKIVKKDEKVRKNFELKNINTVDFAKKLLGQIVFLYFLQKKGWFGVKRDAEWGTGAKDFLRQLFEKKYGDYKNFFNDILEPLFYEALARERDDNFYSRFNCKIPFLNGGLFEPIGSYDWVHKDMILQNELFANNNRTPEGDEGDGILDVFDRFNFTVKEDEPLEKEVAIDPELLGKLYEKFNAIRPDNFYEFKRTLVSGKRNLEKQFNKKFGVYYTPREIVHYMCQESLINYLHTSVNQELMKHPAKIPRQIKLIGTEDPEQISFQTDEETVNKDDIQMLIKYGEQFAENEVVVEEKGQETKTYKHKLPETIRNNAKIIDEMLKNIKVCDPAVGSGAFPVGMMHEIVKTRNVLTTFLSLRERKVTKESQAGDHFAYTHDDNRTIYNFKRDCIENSLYGVDIDPGACEIAKLRLWLSLIVDEEDIRQIKPLPNLDYKIMQGNSLISEFLWINFDIDKDQQSGTLKFESEIDPLIKQFQEKKNKFLNEPDRNKKEHLKQEIESLIVEIFEEKLKKQKSQYFSQLKSIEEKYSILPNEEQQNKYVAEEKEKLYKETGFNLEQVERQLKEYTSGRKIRPFFPWKIYFAEVFQDKGGFDVVIANPPYIKEYIKRTAFDGLRKSPYYQGKMDIWYFFACKSVDLLRGGGFLTFIAQNNWVTSYGASKMREKVIKDTQIIQLLDFGSYFVFENSDIQTMIMIFKVDSNVQRYKFDCRKLKEKVANSKDILDLLNKKTNSKLEYLSPLIQRSKYIDKTLTFSDSNIEAILNKISQQSNFKLTEKEVAQGIVPNPDVVNVNNISKLPSLRVKKENIKIGSGVFIVNRDYFNQLPKKESKYIKPIYEPHLIDKYTLFDYDKEIIYITKKNFKNDAPKLISHLEKFKEIMEGRRENKQGKLAFYHLHWPRDDYFFEEGGKILAVRKCATPTFVYTENEAYVMMSVNVIRSKRINLKYLTGLLNSKLVAFWLKYKGKMQGNNYQIDKEPLLALPIKKPDYSQQQLFVDLVDKILSITQSSDYLENPERQAKVKEYEHQIDQMVYKLYDLTPKEIEIIETFSRR